VIVGRHQRDVTPVTKPEQAVTKPEQARATNRRPHSKSRPFFVGVAFLAAIGFFLVNIVDPYSGATASPDFKVGNADRFNGQPIQELAVASGYSNTVSREAYTVKEKPKPPPPPPPVATTTDDSDSSDGGGGAPAVGTPDPGSAQAYALSALQAQGMGQDQFNCLVALWNRESGWNVYSYNASSGAYGIPQALPGSKMASAGPDWQTNFVTQVNWGLGYVNGRYGSPCGAWAHSESSGWY
jgi:hypothetical protein